MAVFYFLGGIGVREHDIVAAIAVTAVYLVNMADGVLTARQFPGFLAILLIANIRGCWIAAKWLRSGDPDLIPLRMNESWRDKLVDQMPAKIWPHIKIAFYVVASIVLLLTIAGSVVLIVHGPPPLRAPRTNPDAIVHGQ